MADYELEADVESRICSFCQKQGWLCLKLILVSMMGFPDRTIITNHGVVFFELKRPRGGRLKKQQDYWLKTLSSKGGCKAYRVNSFDQFLALMSHHIDVPS